MKTLQSEGVEAGKKAGEKTKKQAEQILSHASAEAERILYRARGDADKQLLRGQTELELAARDVINLKTSSVAWVKQGIKSP